MADNRLRRAKLPASLLVLVILYVSACVPEPITDLRAVEVRRVPASAFPEPGELRNALMGRGEVLWKLSFEGDADWTGEVRQHNLNSYANAVRCDLRDYGLDTFGPYVGKIPITTQHEAIQIFKPTSKTLRYDIYTTEAGSYRSVADFNAPMPSYDLTRERIPLCIRIAGGAMHGAYNRSNEVRLVIGAER